MSKGTLNLFFLILVSSCLAQKGGTHEGTVQGQVGEYVGNCMPAPNTPPCKPTPLSSMVIITELSRAYDPTLAVDSTKSNDDGTFRIDLPAGVYSLFIKDEASYVCTMVSCPSDCYCSPVKIAKDSTTIIQLTIDHASW